VASIVAADLVPYHSANQSDVDGSTVGGAIDTLRRPDFTQMTSNDTIRAVSSSASDTTQTVTVEARTASGTVVSETKTLTGTTAITFSVNATVERVLKVELSATCVGTITIASTTGPGTNFSRVIAIGERGFSAIHRKGASSTSGTTNYYAKFAWKNTNGTNALLGATVSESADPTGLITHALETSVSGSGTATNRQTAPGAATAFGNAAITLTTATGTADLASGANIGVWLLLALATNNAAIRSTYTSQIAGSTT
jgi:hypothetical protein